MTALTIDYQPSGRGDAMVAGDGSLRPEWVTAVNQVAGVGGSPASYLTEISRRSSRLLDMDAAGHLARDADAPDVVRPWRLDPLPYILTTAEFDLLRQGVAQRLVAVRAVLADLYGSRASVRSGAVPAAALSQRAFRPAAATAAGAVGVVHMAVDVARTVDGRWIVVQHTADAPVGLGFALLNRSVSQRVTGEALRDQRVASHHDHLAVFRSSLLACAPPGASSARCVVLTGGPLHPAYVEHSLLARDMGFHLVEGGDVVIRAGGGLWLRSLEGLEPIDIAVRQVADDEVDPLEVSAHSRWAGVPGVVWGAQRGMVALVNGFGVSLVDSSIVQRTMGDTSMQLLGESLLLPQRVDSDVIQAAPSFVDGGIVSAPVVLRLHAAIVDGHVSVLPGGVGRMLNPGDDPCTPTSGRCKDIWVVGGRASAPVTVRGRRVPQVDFGGSVPRRVVDAMWCLGWAMERAEQIARAQRVVLHELFQSVQDTPAADSSGDRQFGLRLAAELLSLEVGDVTAGSSAGVADLLSQSRRALCTVLHDVAIEAATVREYLPSSVGLVLAGLDGARQRLIDDTGQTDDTDDVLVHLAAFSGLLNESTVRGPAWRFADMGRRLQRGRGVLVTTAGVLGVAVSSEHLQLAATALLGCHESLVAYRRRYRTDVEVAAVLDSLVHDDTNPRSLAFQLDRLREHLAALHFADGIGRVDRAALAAGDDPQTAGRLLGNTAHDLTASMGGALDHLDALVSAIRARWLDDPIRPLGGRRSLEEAASGAHVDRRSW